MCVATNTSQPFHQFDGSIRRSVARFISPSPGRLNFSRTFYFSRLRTKIIDLILLTDDRYRSVVCCRVAYHSIWIPEGWRQNRFLRRSTPPANFHEGADLYDLCHGTRRRATDWIFVAYVRPLATKLPGKQLRPIPLACRRCLAYATEANRRQLCQGPSNCKGVVADCCCFITANHQVVTANESTSIWERYGPTVSRGYYQEGEGEGRSRLTERELQHIHSTTGGNE